MGERSGQPLQEEGIQIADKLEELLSLTGNEGNANESDEEILFPSQLTGKKMKKPRGPRCWQGLK